MPPGRVVTTQPRARSASFNRVSWGGFAGAAASFDHDEESAAVGGVRGIGEGGVAESIHHPLRVYRVHRGPAVRVGACRWEPQRPSHGTWRAPRVKKRVNPERKVPGEVCSRPRCARFKGMSADNHDMNYSAETYVVAGAPCPRA